MKRAIFLFLMLLPLVIAQNYEGDNIKEIYSGWMWEGGNFTADGIMFFVKAAGTDAGKVSITYEKEIVIVDEGICQESGTYFVCYMEYKLYKYDTLRDKEINQFNIIVRKKTADVSFERRWIDAEDIYPWQEVEIVTRFTNNGLLDIPFSNFTESFPDSVRITKVSTCSLRNNSVVWSGPLPMQKSVSCSYTIKMLEQQSYSFQARLDYSSYGKVETITSEKLAVAVRKPDLEISSMLIAEDTSLGDKVVALYNISNVGRSGTVRISKFEIMPPAGHKVVTYSKGIEKDGNLYRFVGSLGMQETLMLNLTFEPTKPGDHVVKGNLVYFYGTRRIEIETSDSFNVTIDNITTQIKEPGLVAGERVNLTVVAFNKGSKDRFNNITVVVSSPIAGLDGEGRIDSLFTRNHRDAVTIEFTAPEVEETAFFPVRIEFFYHTIYGDPLYSTYNLTINVTPRQIGAVEIVEETNGEKKSIPESFADLVEQNTPVFVGLGLIFGGGFLILILLMLWKKRKARAYTFEDLLREESMSESEKIEVMKKIEENKNQ